MSRHILVIGGGIAGLSAALRLADSNEPGLRVTVVEQSNRLGGKIRTGEVAGVPIETGAETFIARRAEDTGLIERAGLSDRLIHPAQVPAALALGGRLHNLPRGTVMGVPADPSYVAEVLSDAGLARLSQEPATDGPLLAPDEDIAVGALVRRRYGDEITDRLVDPLLGGVYAGSSDGLSLETTIPALAEQARRHDTLSAAVRACLPEPATGPARPVFGSVEGGLSVLVDSVARASGAQIRHGLPVRELHRTPTGWRAVLGETRDPQVLEADWVVLAVPARPASRLLTDIDSAAAAEIGGLDYASVGLVTLALPEVDLPARSGFLVPASQGLTIKAATFFSRKWPHAAEAGVAIVRASIGRYGDTDVLQRDDEDLVALTRADLSTVLKTALPTPIYSAVHRWGGGLPQYAPGHLDRIRRARASLAAQPISLAGAAFDGVGIPACIASGQAAADLAVSTGM